VKIALTADNHLTTLARNPERFKTLENLLKRCDELKIKLLIIAGDLFDQNIPNYVEFEDLYKKHRPPGLTTAVIPGNHDPNLKPENIIADGLIVHDHPALLPLNQSWKVLFVPYQQNADMGSAIAPFKSELTNQRWILVGHGDWSPGIQKPSSYEPGVYMPLTRSDLVLYKPELVFLGHIHQSYLGENVYYPGSPCPIDTTETGLRSFLVADLKSGKISTELVDSPLIYFEERFVMLPRKNELTNLKDQINTRIKSWELPPGWENRVRVSASVAGIASDRKAVYATVQEGLSPFQIMGENNPNLDQLYHLSDPDRDLIAQRVQDWIAALEWAESPTSPNKAEILEEALKVIYGVY
jgi:exonuclease SbcD